MARPIEASPVVTGEDAEKILKEIREGTPLTPERIELFKRADEIFRNSGSIFRMNHETP
jgi:hypothetical protein